MTTEPDAPRQRLALTGTLEPERLSLADDGVIPNNTLPALIHHGSVHGSPDPPGDPVAGKGGPLTRPWGSTAT